MRGLLALVVAVVLAAPASAWACAVCGPGTEENRTAFILTTAFLTLLPLAVIGTIIGWLVKRARMLDEEEEALSPSSSPS
jgi:hypothetical protein